MKPLLLLFFVVAFLRLDAQQYQYVPMVTPGTTWQLVSLDPRSGPPHEVVECNPTNWQIMLTDKDTFLHGQYCKVVMMRKKTRVAIVPYGSSQNCSFPNSEPIVAAEPDMYYMGLREVNKQVFNQYSNLMYDFNLQVGQSTPFGYMGTITAIDTVQIGNTLRKRFYTNIGSEKDTIIEGIGSMRKGPNVEGFPYVWYAKLSCYSINGNALYSDPQYPCGAIFPKGTHSSVAGTGSEQGLSVCPNPFNDQLTIEATDGRFVTIYNSVGVEVLRQSMHSKTTVATGSLLTGLYFLVIKDEQHQILTTRKLLKN